MPVNIPAVFITHAATILGDTNNGLTGSNIAKFCAAYAIDFNKNIPYPKDPFPDAPNKRTALEQNLLCFEPEQQFKIIKELCENDTIKDIPDVRKLKIQLITRHGNLNPEADTVNEVLIEETRHWLQDYPEASKEYEAALVKFNNNVFERNLLDDLRLSLEQLLRGIFNNQKSLENQLSDLGTFIQANGGSKELANMFQKLVDYYSKYQNSFVKHNNAVIEEEIEFIFELSSSFMKHLVRMNT